MITNVKDITIRFVCAGCHRTRTIYLGGSMDMDNLIRRVTRKKCLSCGKEFVDVASMNFSHENGHSLMGVNK